MSLFYRFAADAMLAFKELDAELQESVLDLLEEVAENPWRVRPDDAGECILDADVVVADVAYVVFVTLLIDAEAQRLTIIGVGASRWPL